MTFKEQLKMREFEIDSIAEKCLVSSPNNFKLPETVDSNEVADQIRHRVLMISFDCTPNWGIRGIQPAESVQKRNWYFRDLQSCKTARERHGNLDINRFTTIVDQAVGDLVDHRSRVVGFGLYGSYFYRRNALLPEDLDVLVITEGTPGVAIDALRYRSSDLRKVYIDQTKTRPSTDEIGLSVVSAESFNAVNKSYIVTDCALLDISTTISHGMTVDAPPLPPYVIIQNAQKIVQWGISSILYKPFSLLSRIDEAIRMRKMLIEDNGAIQFNPFALEESLPSKEDILLGMNDTQLLEISKALINVLHKDEEKIREYVATRLELYYA